MQKKKKEVPGPSKIFNPESAAKNFHDIVMATRSFDGKVQHVQM